MKIENSMLNEQATWALGVFREVEARVPICPYS